MKDEKLNSLLDGLNEANKMKPYEEGLGQLVKAGAQALWKGAGNVMNKAANSINAKTQAGTEQANAAMSDQDAAQQILNLLKSAVGKPIQQQAAASQSGGSKSASSGSKGQSGDAGGTKTPQNNDGSTSEGPKGSDPQKSSDAPQNNNAKPLSENIEYIRSTLLREENEQLNLNQIIGYFTKVANGAQKFDKKNLENYLKILNDNFKIKNNDAIKKINGILNGQIQKYSSQQATQSNGEQLSAQPTPDAQAAQTKDTPQQSTEQTSADTTTNQKIPMEDSGMSDAAKKNNPSAAAEADLETTLKKNFPNKQAALDYINKIYQ